MQMEMFQEPVAVVAIGPEPERWAVVEEFQNYEVSNLGRFRKRWNGKIIGGSDHESGYRNIGFMKNGKLYMRLAHRVVAKAFVAGETELKNEVNHRDKHRQHNWATNLEWMTHADNAKHSKRKSMLAM